METSKLKDLVKHFEKDYQLIGNSEIQKKYAEYFKLPQIVLYQKEFRLVHLAQLIALTRRQMKAEEKKVLSEVVKMIVEKSSSWADDLESEENWENLLKIIDERKKRNVPNEMIPIWKKKDNIYPYQTIEDFIKKHKINEKRKKVIWKVLREGTRYKALFCTNKPCSYGDMCCFAHSFAELSEFRFFNNSLVRNHFGYPLRWSKSSFVP